jgi:hypothetical protein
VTVREKIDQLASEPAVADLGYAADQRLVASALLGLQLLADEIDQLKAAGRESVEPPPVDHVTGAPDAPEDPAIAEQVADLSEQVRKLTKAVKKVSRRIEKLKKA